MAESDATRPSTSTLSSTTSSTWPLSNYFSTSGGRPTIRYVLSDIKATLTYPEIIGILLILLLSPSLSDALIGCKQTHVMDHVLTHVVGISLAYVAAFFVLTVFGEMHHYYGDCGGLVSISKQLSCSLIWPVVLAVTLAGGVCHVAYCLCNLAEMVERLSQYYLTDVFSDWADSRMNLIALICVLVMYVTSLLGIAVVGRVSVIVGPLCLVSVFLVGGYGIVHKLQPTEELTTRNASNPTITNHPSAHDNYTMLTNELRDGYHLSNSTLVDTGVVRYLGYISHIVGQVVVVVWLLALTEDVKLKKPIYNAVGGIVFLLSFIAVMFLNVSVSHVVSDANVYIDEVGQTVGVPSTVLLVISVLSCLSIILKGIFLLYSLCRVMVHVAITKEEGGVSGIPCKLLKMPLFVNCCQCLMVGGILVLKIETIHMISHVLIFFYVGLGGICHVLHRYKSLDVTETTPLFGSFGAFKALRIVRTLLILLVVASIAVCTADVIESDLEMDTDVLQKGYIVLRICLVLTVVCCVSVIASFQQQQGIHKVYRRIAWSPLIPCCLIIMGCAVGTFNWMWGSISAGFVLILALIIILYEKLYTHCCCLILVDDASSVT